MYNKQYRRKAIILYKLKEPPGAPGGTDYFDDRVRNKNSV